jgi:hypothetical protein
MPVENSYDETKYWDCECSMPLFIKNRIALSMDQNSGSKIVVLRRLMLIKPGANDCGKLLYPGASTGGFLSEIRDVPARNHQA